MDAIHEHLGSCLSILTEGRETDLDILFATQAKCQIITNSLTCLSLEQSFEDARANVPSKILTTAMLQQLDDIRQKLPERMRSESKTIAILASWGLSDGELTYTQ